MAANDTEAFMRERAARFDSNLDITPGSPYDVQVIQPLIRRLGVDPFTVDLSAFIDARLRQSFPDMALDEGDAIVDLLNKPATLLWDPIIREVTRVIRNQSFNDPTTLTLAEAEALGANLFAERRTGDFARGQGRIFFGQPQSIAISPVNFMTSKGGLRFFPTEAQIIRAEEMLVNLADDGTYFFDINVIAEDPGDKYNIGLDELVSIANVDAAVKVTNLRRFKDGQDEDSAEEFVARAQGELTERSLTTLRGVSAQLTNGFPEIRRLNVVGFNDPEMQRDIIKGGGLGAVIFSSRSGEAVEDLVGGIDTKRLQDTSGVDFTAVLGPGSQEGRGFVLSVVDGTSLLTDPVIQDFTIERVISPELLEISEEVLALGKTGLRYSIRRNELTLSDIPGGIIFPDGPNGTVDIPNDEVHVGGSTDVYVRGTSFDEASIILDSVTDDIPELTGTGGLLLNPLPTLGVIGIQLSSFVLGTNYQVNDPTYMLLSQAGRDGLSLQIVNGPVSDNLGVYRILKVDQSLTQSPEIQLDPTPPTPDGLAYTWKLFNEVNVDLLDPKETRYSGTTLGTVQASDIVTLSPPVDLNTFGVVEGDTLRIENGPDAGDYTLVADPLGAGEQLQINVELTSTTAGVTFTVFRPNEDGGITVPLVRISSIELLDSNNQPLGTVIPYAKPVDIQSRAFQNPARGVKHTFTDVRLGLVVPAPAGGAYTNPGGTINIDILRRDGSTSSGSMGVPAAVASAAALGALIDTAIATILGVPSIAATTFTGMNGGVGVRPVGAGIVFSEVGPGLNMVAFFGTSEARTTADIRSTFVDGKGGWDELNPQVDYSTGLDVFQTVNGNQVGFYAAPYSGPETTDRVDTLYVGNSALIIRNVDAPHDSRTRQFLPEINVRSELGARSLGSVRCFFLDPTTIEFGPDSVFTLETATGDLRFVPDPTLDQQLLPPLPSDNKSNDGSVNEGVDPLLFTSGSQNFLKSGIQPGDRLVIDFIPLTGTITLTPGPIVGLAAQPAIPLPAKTFVFSLNNGPDITLHFIRDDVSLNDGEVTPSGVVDQINARAGQDIAQLTGTGELEFVADALIIVRGSGTANPLILGDVAGTAPIESFTDDQDNLSPQAGTYDIDEVFITSLQLQASTPLPPAAPYADPLESQGFRVRRSSLQRISTTQMAEQQAEADLYYFDVELVSEGTGDQWNIDEDQQLTATGYRSDGYHLTTDDENLTFSTAERPKLVLSKSIFEQGVDDDPNNATQIVDQNLQVNYARSQLVADVQAFVSSETERVIVENVLIRHLIPHFVRFDMNYVGGSREEVVLDDVEKYLRDLFPANALESSDLQKIASDRGARSIENPIDIIAIVHRIDRTIQAARSQNALTTGRLASFIPDVLNIVRLTT